MGCRSSSSVTPDIAQIHRQGQAINEKVISHKFETYAVAFQRLDEEILVLEMKCPGARLATAEAWVEHLEKLQREKEISTNVFEPKTLLNSEKDDLLKIALQLGITSSAGKAAEQEEFLAKISTRSINITEDQVHGEMIQHAQQRMEELKKEYSQLRSLYEEQDGLWASITGGTYTTSLEERLDREVEGARQIRDRLASVAEQWRTSGALLKVATKCAQQALQYWNLIPVAARAEDKLTLVLDCRHALLAATKAYEGAQIALPQAEIVRNRLLSSIHHSVQYILTDMVSEQRFTQSTRTFESFHDTLIKTTTWLQDTFSRSLGKDIRESEEHIILLGKKLRQERIRFISTNAAEKIYLKRGSEGL
ncbi:uncharacterized protein DMENIID0001_107710 [Sergentomyia squamirostris]